MVLNGGVSLAVWMGGVALELDRLTRGDGPYAVLLDLVRSTARADVIAGTSAGGINGAALALAQVNRSADLGTLRDIWADQGRMESLLRQPFQGAPASLLQGDEYFLPALRQAMRRLAEPLDRTDPDERPIDLTITTTLLHGSRTVTVDALGQRLPQTRHDGRFRFRRDPSQGPPPGEEVRDDFAPDRIGDTSLRLALAARSTAGFPVAFEPSFVPAGAPADRPDAGERLDMSDTISWRTTGPTGETPPDRSRFTVDGGLLANTPTRSALEAIDRMPAGSPVRRVLLLVYPHAPADAQDAADRQGDPPTLARTMSGVLGALSSQGSRTFVDEVEEHNRRAASHRGSRQDVLAAVSGEPRELYRLVQALWEHYRALRMRRAARDLALRVPSQPSWSYERVRRTAEAAQLAWERQRRVDRPRLPYIPDRALAEPDEALPTPSDGWPWGITTALGVLDGCLDVLKRMAWVTTPEQAAGVEEARQALYTARTELRRLRRETDDLWMVHPVVATLRPDTDYWTLRLAAYEWQLLGTGREDLLAVADQVSLAAAAGLPAAQQGERTREVRAALEAVTGAEPGGIGRRTRAQVEDVVRRVAGVVGVLAALPEDRVRLAELGHWRALLVAGGEDAGTATLLTRLLGVEVATSTLADEMSTAGFPIDLVQVSLQARNDFARYSLTGDDKLGGMAVSRFGGFLKRSWRLNDWTWGRLDAAGVLCAVVLDPQRLRRVAVLEGTLQPDRPAAERYADQYVGDVIQLLFGGPPPPDARIADAVEGAVRELTDVFDQGVPPGRLPPELPCLARLAAWSLHLRSAADELPAVAAAVRADRVDGANRRSRGEFFLEENRALLAALEAMPPEPALPATPEEPVPPAEAEARAERLRLGLAALEAFDRAGIGREPLQEEGTSDQMMRTVTTATGVGITVLDGEGSGLSAAKPVTRTLRGLVLLPYWTITGLARGGTIAGFLALLALSLGGTLVALSLFGLLPAWASGPAAALGFGALLGAFAYAALRTGSVLHGLVLLSPVIPLVVFALTRPSQAEQAAGSADAAAGTSAAQASATVVAIALLVVGLLILGSLPAPLGSPLAVLTRVRQRLEARVAGLTAWATGRPGRVVGVVLAVAAAVAALVALWLWRAETVGAVADALAWMRQRTWALVLAAVVLVAIGAIAARHGGQGFRLYRPVVRRGAAADDVAGDGSGGYVTRWRDEDVVHPAGASAGWAVLYGVGYLLVGVVLARVAAGSTDEWWVRAGLATAFSFAAVLLLVVPWLVPMRARARLRRTVLSDVSPEAYRVRRGDPALPPATVGSRLVDRLATRSLTYRHLCTATEPAHDGVTGEIAEGLWLSPAGERLGGLVHRRLAEVLGVPPRLTDLDLSHVGTRPPVGVRSFAGRPWLRRAAARDLVTLLRWSDGLSTDGLRVHAVADLPERPEGTSVRVGSRTPPAPAGPESSGPESSGPGQIGVEPPVRYDLDLESGGVTALRADGTVAVAYSDVWRWLRAELPVASQAMTAGR